MSLDVLEPTLGSFGGPGCVVVGIGVLFRFGRHRWFAIWPTLKAVYSEQSRSPRPEDLWLGSC